MGEWILFLLIVLYNTKGMAQLKIIFPVAISIFLYSTWCIYKYTELYKKQSRNRPGVAQRVPGGLASQISMTFSTWRWWGRRPHSPACLYTQKIFLVHIFTRGWVDPRAMLRSEGNMPLKNPLILPEIDLGTFRLLAQLLNHYATPGPPLKL